MYFNTTITPGDSLVFFDEIQACPRALRALRFFYEKMPDLHVAAAGSLLELTLSEIPSFGVGRIHSLFMFPMTFAEYLHASGNDMLNTVISASSFQQPVDPVIHEKILDKIKIFLIIGGMPKVVDTYINKKDFQACQLEIDNIINSLIDDFAKYKEKDPSLRLEETFYSTAQQAGNKFVYSKVGEGIESSKLYKEALELLVKAGTRGQMQSLHLFLNERNLDYGLRISHENFSQYDKIKTIPIYAVKNIEQLG